MIEWFVKGGLFMWPILLSSVWALTLMLERLYTYTKLSKTITSEANKAFEESGKIGPIEAGRTIRAVVPTDSVHGLMTEVLAAAWDPDHAVVSVAERNVEEVLFHHKPEIDRHLSTLSTLAGIQPLLGLLGTITGMITTFSVISSQGTGNAQALADGISEAMITTQAGLCAALPILLGHNYLRTRSKGIMSLLQKSCARALKELERDLSRRG